MKETTYRIIQSVTKAGKREDNLEQVITTRRKPKVGEGCRQFNTEYVIISVEEITGYYIEDQSRLDSQSPYVVMGAAPLDSSENPICTVIKEMTDNEIILKFLIDKRNRLSEAFNNNADLWLREGYYKAQLQLLNSLIFELSFIHPIN